MYRHSIVLCAYFWCSTCATGLTRSAVLDDMSVYLGINADDNHHDTVQTKVPILWAVPTTSRGNHTYLSEVVASIHSEIETFSKYRDTYAPYITDFRAMIFNSKPYQEHAEYNFLKKRYYDEQRILFVENVVSIIDPWYGTISEPDNMNNPANIPGHEVRQQNIDLFSLLASAKSMMMRTYGRDHKGVVMIVEDDSVPCRGSLRELYKLLESLHQDCRKKQFWDTLSTSYGLNGIAIRFDIIDRFMYLLYTRAYTQPPGLLVYSGWPEAYNFVPETTHSSLKNAPLSSDVFPVDISSVIGRWNKVRASRNDTVRTTHAHLAGKTNLFKHLGVESSFFFRKNVHFRTRKTPGCYKKRPGISMRKGSSELLVCE